MLPLGFMQVVFRFQKEHGIDALVYRSSSKHILRKLKALINRASQLLQQFLYQYETFTYK